MIMLVMIAATLGEPYHTSASTVGKMVTWKIRCHGGVGDDSRNVVGESYHTSVSTVEKMATWKIRCGSGGVGDDSSNGGVPRECFTSGKDGDVDVQIRYHGGVGNRGGGNRTTRVFSSWEDRARSFRIR
jgi:hypothetical protein